MNRQTTEFTRSLCILNECGDTTIAWTPDQDEHWEELIRRKMAQGVTFFITEIQDGGRLPPIKKELLDAADARRHRSLSIPDEDLAAFVSSGKAEAVPTADTPPMKGRSRRISRDPAEVARTHSVGVRQQRGG